jgi:hypothetical protein
LKPNGLFTPKREERRILGSQEYKGRAVTSPSPRHSQLTPTPPKTQALLLSFVSCLLSVSCLSPHSNVSKWKNEEDAGHARPDFNISKTDLNLCPQETEPQCLPARKSLTFAKRKSLMSTSKKVTFLKRF